MRTRDLRGGSKEIIRLLLLGSSPNQDKALSPLSCSPVGETEGLMREGRALCSHGFYALDLLRTFWDRGVRMDWRGNPGVSKKLQTAPDDGWAFLTARPWSERR